MLHSFHNSKKNSIHNFGTIIIWTAAIYFSTASAESDADKIKNQKFFLKQIFTKYGSNDVMTMEGFEHMLHSIGLERLILHHGHNSSETTADSEGDDLNHTRLNEIESKNGDKSLKLPKISSGSEARNKCLSMSELLNTFDIDQQQGTISRQQFSSLCPAIIYELDHHTCDHGHDDHSIANSHLEDGISYLVWVYAAVAVIIISLSGLLVVAIIPIMRGSFYNVLLQFLVAMAVGSLIGDALLHLLPHALANEDQHEWEGDENHKSHKNHEVAQHSGNGSHVEDMIWKGLVAVVGILLFFMAERLLTVVSSRRKLHSNSTPGKTELQGDIELAKTGEKLCKQNKYNSYGFCYGEVTMEMLKGLNESSVCEDKDHHNCLEKASQTEQDGKECLRGPPEEVKLVGGLRPIHGEGDHFDDVETSWNNGVIVNNHDHRNNGHSHSHSHNVPASISAVAWMVIMGDGLHNFSDGLAIGAAFSSSITGGVSTSIAVLCHELPHELGDFAVLLRSGMTAKQALAYNGLSSVLCFMGMLLGVVLGNIASVTSWIFAGAAGMFIYIALVDMVPELNSSASVSSGKGSEKVYMSAQFLGMSIGVTIMLLIALYEHDLQKILHYN